MKAEAIAELLQKQIDRLTRNSEEDIAGFFFVLPPDDGTVMTNMWIGDGPSKNAFFKYLADQIGEAQKAPDGPYVGTRGLR